MQENNLEVLEQIRMTNEEDLVSIPQMLLSLGAGEMRVRKGEMILTCIGHNAEVSAVIIPEEAWDKINTTANLLCFRFQMGTTLALESINTQYPNLVHVFYPIDKYMLLEQMTQEVYQYFELQSNIKEEIVNLFSSTKYIKPEKSNKIHVQLRRIGKNVEKAELFTSSKLRRKNIPIYHTSLRDVQVKPYSKIEVFKFKIKRLIA